MVILHSACFSGVLCVISHAAILRLIHPQRFKIDDRSIVRSVVKNFIKRIPSNKVYEMPLLWNGFITHSSH
jgi:hypothetical protein